MSCNPTGDYAYDKETTMGNWSINIRGVGVHHNHKPEDANEMAAKFVQELKGAGHHIASATITHGGEEDLAAGGEQAQKATGPSDPPAGG